MNNIIFFSDTDHSSVGLTPNNTEVSVEYINKNNINTVFIDGNFEFKNYDFFNDIYVESIALNNNRIDSSKFPILKSIKNVFLNNFEGILDISRFPNLYQLTMDWSNKIKFIAANNTIKRLTVWKYNSKSKTLKELSMFSDIEYMQINHTNIQSLEYIDLFNKMNHFELNYGTNILSIKYIDLLKNSLEELYIDHTKKIDNFDRISLLKNLKLLVLSDCGRIDNVKFVDSMPNLEDFRIVNTDINDGDLSPLLKLKIVRIYPFKKNYSHRSEIFE
jgi:hypothetical protein